jgi:ADP-heptose:LPS heptosyltransferase
MEAVTKILVIRFSSIGDIILTTPVLRIIKTQLDGRIELHYLTKKSFEPLLKNNPHIDKLILMDNEISEVRELIKSSNYHYVIDLHRNLRSAVARKMAKGLDFVFNKHNIEKWFLVNFGLDFLPRKHVVRRYIEAADALGLKEDGVGCEFFPDKGSSNPILKSGTVKVGGYLVIAVGAAHEGKRMTCRQIAAICDRAEVPVVLLGGKGDEYLGDLALSALNQIGLTSIDESALILRDASAVISGDSGMMHLAAAMGSKVISIWGCTSPRFGMEPYKPHPDSIILEPEGRTRRPCSKLGNRCKYGMKNKCITAVSTERILEAVNRLIRTTP